MEGGLKYSVQCNRLLMELSNLNARVLVSTTMTFETRADGIWMESISQRLSRPAASLYCRLGECLAVYSACPAKRVLLREMGKDRNIRDLPTYSER